MEGGGETRVLYHVIHFLSTTSPDPCPMLIFLWSDKEMCRSGNRSVTGEVDSYGSARVAVNTADNWGGSSRTIEMVSGSPLERHKPNPDRVRREGSGLTVTASKLISSTGRGGGAVDCAN